jgi:hypothetical protein
MMMLCVSIDARRFTFNVSRPLLLCFLDKYYLLLLFCPILMLLSCDELSSSLAALPTIGVPAAIH